MNRSRKKNVKKVIELLSAVDSSGIDLNYLVKHSEIEKNEAVKIFNYLAENKWVILSVIKDGTYITKRTDIDYLDLLKTHNKYIVTKAPTTAIKISRDISIGVIIVVISYLITKYFLK